MNELAANILLQQNTKLNGIADRAYQDTRQSYPAYPFAPDYSTPSNGGGASNYYGNQMVNFSLIISSDTYTYIRRKIDMLYTLFNWSYRASLYINYTFINDIERFALNWKVRVLDYDYLYVFDSSALLCNIYFCWMYEAYISSISTNIVTHLNAFSSPRCCPEHYRFPICLIYLTLVASWDRTLIFSKPCPLSLSTMT